jgi:hypothetical protein
MKYLYGLSQGFFCLLSLAFHCIGAPLVWASERLLDAAEWMNARRAL